MKIPKQLFLVATVTVIAAISIAAVNHDDNRPSSIPAERWITMSENAGFAITPNNDASSVNAELYLKTSKGWVRASIQNPTSMIPVIQQ